MQTSARYDGRVPYSSIKFSSFVAAPDAIADNVQNTRLALIRARVAKRWMMRLILGTFERFLSNVQILGVRLILMCDLYSGKYGILEAELDEQQDENSQSEKDDSEDMEGYMKKMNTFKDNLFQKAKHNIVNAQLNQKRDNDKQHGKKKVLL